MMVTFTGMVFPDAHPVTVAEQDVRRVEEDMIPPPLRAFAYDVLSAVSGDEWRTLGEFRYGSSADYETAVGRWTRSGVLYGIERES